MLTSAPKLFFTLFPVSKMYGNTQLEYKEECNLEDDCVILAVDM